MPMLETFFSFFSEFSNIKAVLKIILIDILLGGDNAILIALACKDLSPKLRKKGIFWGTALAIILRIILVSFAMTLLNIAFLKLIGGLLLLWIGIKMFIPHDDHSNVTSSDRFWSAIKTILVADLIMSIDNVVAMAAAAQSVSQEHQTALIIFGVLLSIPIVVWGSQIVLKALDKYPIIIKLGGALMGWIAGGLILGDSAIKNYFHIDMHAPFATIANINVHWVLIAEIIGAICVYLIGSYLAKKHHTK
jgi:YjbE family integral membrane protein